MRAVSGEAPRSVVFVGDLTVDLLVDDMSAGASKDNQRAFQRTALPAEAWAEQVSKATSGSRAEAHPGGSIANVAAAFAADAGGARMCFVCVEQPLIARLRPPLWWPGYSRSAADLRARAIMVLGYDVAPNSPEIPGALVFLDAAGKVTRLIANAQTPRAPVEAPGEFLVVRSDHGRLLRREYIERFAAVSILLADDGLGWGEVADLVSNTERAWIFGTAQQVEAVASRLLSETLERVRLVGTDGPRPCIILRGRRREKILLEVPPLARIVSDLGAGDAYMGGFLARAFGGGSPRDAHSSGCAAAAVALSRRGAREEPTEDLNRVFPEISRVSPRNDEGKIFHRVRRSPGLTVISGGQTGVESVAIQEASKLGLPIHAIMPKGLRQEKGHLTAARAARLGRFRIHEMGSESFRYRTWATVYAADAVILLDHAGGEGSEETRRAANHLSRPLLDAGREPLRSHAVARWLESQAARVVLVAGSRASLLAKTGRHRTLHRQMSGVMRGLCLANRRLLTDGSEVPPPPRCERLGIPEAALAGVVVGLLLPNLTVGEWIVLTARDLATAFTRGELGAVVTWPSLFAARALRGAKVLPLGAIPVHYGFLSSSACPGSGDRLAVQYETALADHVASEEFSWWSRFSIGGKAETWLRHGLADVAYDTLRTGATMHELGLEFYFPSHWESLSLIWRA